MKGFTFKLQSVLDAREKNFLDAQLEFALAQQELRKEKQVLNAQQEELEATKLGLGELISSGNIDYTIIFSHQGYIAKLHQDIARQHKIIAEKEYKLSEKNKLMLAALKDKKVMEKLREKEQDAFKKEFERQEMIEIDEMATNRYKKAG